jgi:hypothetical protein
MDNRTKPRWVSLLQLGGSVFWMVAGAFLGPRVDLGIQSELVRCLLIACVGFTVWWWTVLLIWVCTR